MKGSKNEKFDFAGAVISDMDGATQAEAGELMGTGAWETEDDLLRDAYGAGTGILGGKFPGVSYGAMKDALSPGEEERHGPLYRRMDVAVDKDTLKTLNHAVGEKGGDAAPFDAFLDCAREGMHSLALERLGRTRRDAFLEPTCARYDRDGSLVVTVFLGAESQALLDEATKDGGYASERGCAAHALACGAGGACAMSRADAGAGNDAAGRVSLSGPGGGETSLTDAYYWHVYSLSDEGTRSRMDEFWATGRFRTRDGFLREILETGIGLVPGEGGGMSVDDLTDDVMRYEMGWEYDSSHGERYALRVDTEVDGCTGARLDRLLSSGMWDGAGDLLGDVVGEGTDLLFGHLYGHLTHKADIASAEDCVEDLEDAAKTLDEVLEGCLKDRRPLERIRLAEREEAVRARIGHDVALLAKLAEKGYIGDGDVIEKLREAYESSSEEFSTRLDALKALVEKAYVDEDPT